MRNLMREFTEQLRLNSSEKKSVISLMSFQQSYAELESEVVIAY